MASAVLIESNGVVGAPASEDAQRLLRADLRGQIGTLERALCETVADAHPHDLGIERLGGGPARLMGAAELEVLRDRLAARLEDARHRLTALRASQEEARGLVERMLADPAAYRWVRVSREQAGLPGCGHWHVLPRFGPVGLLTGWWRVRISSGCPLATRIEQCPAARRPDRPWVGGRDAGWALRARLRPRRPGDRAGSPTLPDQAVPCGRTARRHRPGDRSR